MTDTKFTIALFRPVQVRIREDPSEDINRYTEDLRQRQKELLTDLIAEQSEQM